MAFRRMLKVEVRFRLDFSLIVDVGEFGVWTLIIKAGCERLDVRG